MQGELVAELRSGAGELADAGGDGLDHLHDPLGEVAELGLHLPDDGLDALADLGAEVLHAW